MKPGVFRGHHFKAICRRNLQIFFSYSAAKQILIYKALNFNLPTFSHTPLILNSEGKKLSKRDCVTSIDEFRDMGYLPEALSNYMAFLGWSPKSAEREILSLEEISEIFD